MKKIAIVIITFIGVFNTSYAQETEEVFSLEEFLAMVKKYHPIVAQADLEITAAEAKLLKSRGAFDPTLTGSMKEKNFKETEYYSLWKGSFKIPTWYGIDLKAGYEQNEGYYLNPEHTTPENGIWSAGVSISLAKGLLYNDRMNALRQAKILQKKTLVQRDIMVASIIAEAAQTYADWLYYFQNKTVIEEFLENAKIRYEGVAKSSRLGETPAIDTVETKITVRKRELELKQAELKLQKAKLKLSNYLWIDNIPLELEDRLQPMADVINFKDVLEIEQLLGNANDLTNHPKLRSLGYDLDSYNLDVKLKQNNLLPTINLEYNFLSPEIDETNYISTDNYKAGLKVKLPLFLRKERGDLKLAKAKRDQAEYKIKQSRWKLTNKVKATEQEIFSLQEQLQITNDIVSDSEVMVAAEKRLFEVGESSIFYINTRENKLIDAILKKNKIANELNTAITKLYESLRIN
ncbi:TolC family protein [Zunongwangia sp.]|uniref:TolC family protein n=1 Tax=Zunongwangia sp. TaxID=1965325 RepID=UPI003AA890D1